MGWVLAGSRGSSRILYEKRKTQGLELRMRGGKGGRFQQRGVDSSSHCGKERESAGNVGDCQA